MSFYVDIHTHLTDPRFHHDLDAVCRRAGDAGFGAIVTNGLDVATNRQVLALAAKYPFVKPALGIYPVQAIAQMLPTGFELKKFQSFIVSDEIDFIRTHAEARTITAIGETGLDGYWPEPWTFKAQEHVFECLIEIAVTSNLPIIVHSRKMERRTIEILAHHRATKVDMHCFGGKTKLAQQAAEQHGWCFSIPANAHRSENFQKLLRSLPETSLMTETDAPYLSPEKGQRSEPHNVIRTVELLAKLRSWSVDQARDQIWQNYQALTAE